MNHNRGFILFRGEENLVPNPSSQDGTLSSPFNITWRKQDGARGPMPLIMLSKVSGKCWITAKMKSVKVEDKVRMNDKGRNIQGF